LQVASLEGAIVRSSKSGRDILWSGKENYQQGRIALDIPARSTIDCIVSYAGVPQHQRLLIDPASEMNPLLVAYQVFDPTSAVLKSIIENRKLKDRDPLELELTVGALLALSGYSTVHVGQLPKLDDGPDIIALAPDGNLLVVECTMDLPKAKAAKKISTLHRRALEVRRTIADAGGEGIEITPVLAVSQPRDILASDIEEARSYGILVWPAEDLEKFRKTLAIPSPEIYDETSQEVDEYDEE
jgi:hypothetical protein